MEQMVGLKNWEDIVETNIIPHFYHLGDTCGSSLSQILQITKKGFLRSTQLLVCNFHFFGRAYLRVQVTEIIKLLSQ